MSRYGYGPESIGRVEWKPTEFEVALQIIDSNNQDAIETGSEVLNRKISPESKISISAKRGYGNVLDVLIDDYPITVGLYSPVDQDFIIFPEFTTESQREFLTELAKQKKDEALAVFYGIDDDKLERVDYEHPEVIQLHQEHYELLQEDQLFEELVAVYNIKSNISLQNWVEIDSYTRFAIGLRHVSLPYNQTRENDIFGLRVIGPYSDVKDVKRRETLRFIPVGKRVLGTKAMTYEPMDHFSDMPDDMFQKLSWMAVGVEALRDSFKQRGLVFDNESLGLTVKSITQSQAA